MRCELVEDRLNRLLDDRQHWSNDSSLLAHCAYCESCRSLAKAYSAILLAVAQAEEVPNLTPGFSARVLAEFASLEADTPRSVTARYPKLQRYLVAAVFLIAALPTALYYRSSSPTTNIAQMPAQPADSFAARWKLTGLLDEESRLSDEVWVSTGREIAKLPHQVRRAAVFSESTPLNGAIRPVAVAWQTLWRVIPGEAVPSDPPAGETSFLVAFPDASLA